MFGLSETNTIKPCHAAVPQPPIHPQLVSYVDMKISGSTRGLFFPARLKTTVVNLDATLHAVVHPARELHFKTPACHPIHHPSAVV